MQKSISIETADQQQLAATFYQSTSTAKGIILINAGTCIKRQFYDVFCKGLTNFGYDVLSYDYRGVGDSAPKQLKGFQASIVDWGRLDMTAAINWLTTHYPEQPKYLIAHSMGGQVMGLTKNLHQLNKIITVASSYGNWRNYRGSFKYKTAFLGYTLIPLMTKIYGYLPAKKFGMGENWPKGVVQDWWSWGKQNIPHAQLMEQVNIPHFYDKLKLPIRAYFLNDDDLATAKTIPQYQSDFSQAALEIQQIAPKDYGLERIGHFGFFFPKCQELWKEAIDWLEQ